VCLFFYDIVHTCIQTNVPGVGCLEYRDWICYRCTRVVRILCYFREPLNIASMRTLDLLGACIARRSSRLQYFHFITLLICRVVGLSLAAHICELDCQIERSVLCGRVSKVLLFSLIFFHESTGIRARASDRTLSASLDILVQ